MQLNLPIFPREARLINDNLLVFDREAYEPAFFQRLWESYRIAIITYRKNVKDQWDKERFKGIDVQVLNHIINMDLCEQETKTAELDENSTCSILEQVALDEIKKQQLWNTELKKTLWAR